jgi:hypothetical protein
VQLQEKYGERVQAISLNVDFEGDGQAPSEQLLAKVQSKLDQLNMACENVISSDPYDDVLSDFDVFSLPAVLIYDSQGGLHKRLDGAVSYEEQVFPEVERLLVGKRQAR